MNISTYTINGQTLTLAALCDAMANRKVISVHQHIGEATMRVGKGVITGMVHNPNTNGWTVTLDYDTEINL